MATFFEGIQDEVLYTDDILIYITGNDNEHQAIMEKVVQRQMNQDLAVNLTKSEFHVKVMAFS